MKAASSQIQTVTLTKNDIPAVLKLAHLAGWNQTHADIERMLDFAPEGCFGVWVDDRLVSTTMAFPYGTDLGWIAMVLTNPEDRGKGYAGIVFDHAIAWLQNLGVAWIKLDASSMGQPLYERRSFEQECRMERMLAPAETARPTAPMGVKDATVADIPLRFDSLSFGADRSRLLAMIASTPQVRIALSQDGSSYAMLRPGSKANQLGPMVCDSAANAEALLQWALASTDGELLQWDLDTGNAEAVALAVKYGFTSQRVLSRMVLPGRLEAPPFRGNRQSVYAIVGFDFG